MELDIFKWLTQVNKAIKLGVIQIFWSNSYAPLTTALGFLIRIGRKKKHPNLNSLPRKASFLTLAYMAHMVWQRVLLHMGTLADEASLPWSYAIWNLMSPQLLKQRNGALKGLRPAVKYLIISSHKDISHTYSHDAKSQPSVRPEGLENWMWVSARSLLSWWPWMNNAHRYENEH